MPEGQKRNEQRLKMRKTVCGMLHISTPAYNVITKHVTEKRKNELLHVKYSSVKKA